MAQALHGLRLQAADSCRVQRGIGTQCFSHGFQGSGQLHGLRALGRAQVAIARRQGQAVVAALGFAAHDVDRHGKLLDHVADDHELLVILFAKQGGARLRARQQLEHHGAHANEEAGAKVAFQNVGQFSGWVYLERLWLGVHLGL